MKPTIEWRPLTPREREIIHVLVRAPFQGQSALQQQLADARAMELDDRHNLAIRPSGGSAPACVTSRIPVEAETEDSDGVLVHILIHVVGGYINEVEVYREDSAPLLAPLDPTQLRVVPTD